MPIIRDGTGENLDPELFPALGVEFGEGAGDAGERVDFEVVKSFDGKSGVVGKGDFAGVSNGEFFAVINVIFVHFVDLNGGVLGVDLAFDEALEDFWHPDVEANLAAGGGDFKR